MSKHRFVQIAAEADILRIIFTNIKMNYNWGKGCLCWLTHPLLKTHVSCTLCMPKRTQSLETHVTQTLCLPLETSLLISALPWWLDLGEGVVKSQRHPGSLASQDQLLADNTEIFLSCQNISLNKTLSWVPIRGTHFF
jgi:hypothetical protein